MEIVDVWECFTCILCDEIVHYRKLLRLLDYVQIPETINFHHLKPNILRQCELKVSSCCGVRPCLKCIVFSPNNRYLHTFISLAVLAMHCSTFFTKKLQKHSNFTVL